jgi:hypothetical protein
MRAGVCFLIIRNPPAWRIREQQTVFKTEFVERVRGGRD